MSLPKIHPETILATIGKLHTMTPNEYTSETLDTMREDGNEQLAQAMASMGMAFIEGIGDVIPEDADPLHVAAYSAEIMMAYTSLMYRVMRSQAEANELNEAWDKVGLE